MGLKRRAALLYLKVAERVRTPRHAVTIVSLAQTLGVDTILDVGANRGQFGRLMRRAGFDGRILSFEPVSDAFAYTSQVSADDPTWTIEQLAVGAAPGRQVIHVSQNSVSSSMLPMGDRHLELAPESAYARDEEVEVTTVADIVERHGVEPGRALLKADVQGYEGAVLDGAGPLVSQFAMALLELNLVELYEGQPMLADLTQRLTSEGHALWTLFPAYVDRTNGRLWWADGLFVRQDLAARFPHRGRPS